MCVSRHCCAALRAARALSRSLDVNSRLVLTASVLLLTIGCVADEYDDVNHANVCIDLSPDGKTAIFSSANGDLYLFDLQTETTTRLTSTERIESCPSFSPDGRRVVFGAAEDETTPSRIFVLELPGLAVSQLTASEGQSDSAPHFTPDGAEIVFSRAFRHRQYGMGGWTWDQYEVCRMPADGSSVSQLTHEEYYQLSRIVPHTDGTLFYAAFASTNGPQAVLYALVPGETAKQVIPRPGENYESVHVWASDPMLSHDQKQLVFCSDRQKPFRYDIVVTDDSGGNARVLVGPESWHNRFPDFFPDDERVLFLAGTKFNSKSRPIYSLWEASLAGQTRQIAPPELFTDPDRWVKPHGVILSDAPKE